jgi:hypothetical protein
MLAITYTKIMKIKVAEWGTPKKINKKTLHGERGSWQKSHVTIFIGNSTSKG